MFDPNEFICRGFQEISNTVIKSKPTEKEVTRSRTLANIIINFIHSDKCEYEMTFLRKYAFDNGEIGMIYLMNFKHI